MVQTTQTEDEIKIVITTNRVITRKPDVVLMPTYLKFNKPPIFFEAHFTHEIDEVASTCRVYNNEVRIVLVKRQKGIWPEIFKQLSKEELQKRRFEITDQLCKESQESDQKAIERFEQKRRNEIDKEIRRDTAMRERVKQFEQNACREALMADDKKSHVQAASKDRVDNALPSGSAGSQPPIRRVGTPAASVRSGGRINVNFSNFKLVTPKRESQENRPMPFSVVNNDEKPTMSSSLDTVD